MLPIDVRRRVDAIWDKIWASGVSNPLTAIEYFSTVLLLQRLNDSEPGRDADTSLQSTLIEHITSGDVSAVAELMLKAQVRFGIGASPDIASASTWQDLSTLKDVLRDVRDLELSDRNHDILGDLFEFMLNHLSTAGHFGQFRTPRHLIRFLVEAVAPQLGETVVDPACGTAGFLIAAHEYRHGTPEDIYVGNEVDATMARIAHTNVLLHEMSGASIRHEDSLRVRVCDADVILANPPFAGAVVADRVIDFESGTLKTELLFIELMMRRLREGGRAGVIVPTGVLTSSASAAVWIRRQLVEGSRLRAVVELPAGIFRPYTGVKTGLLFWSNEPAVEDVLMVRVDHDGYSLDDKREPIEENDLPEVLKLLSGTAANVAHARVHRDELAGNRYNLSPSRYIASESNHDFGLGKASFVDSLKSAKRAAGDLTDELALLEGFVL